MRGGGKEGMGLDEKILEAGELDNKEKENERERKKIMWRKSAKEKEENERMRERGDGWVSNEI